MAPAMPVKTRRRIFSGRAKVQGRYRDVHRPIRSIDNALRATSAIELLVIPRASQYLD